MFFTANLKRIEKVFLGTVFFFYLLCNLFSLVGFSYDVVDVEELNPLNMRLSMETEIVIPKGWEIEKLINSGNYGDVYMIRNDKSELKAIKVQEINLDFHHETFPYEMEKKILTTIKPKNNLVVAERIIEIELVTNDNNPYKLFEIVMPFYEEDLGTFLTFLGGNKKLKIELKDIKKYLFQILNGVVNLHKKGYIHRDLKPGNILIDKQKKECVLCDYGLATSLNRDRKYQESLKNPFVVTQNYRPYEVVIGKKEHTKAVDMWSVGCIFSELVTLDKLFPHLPLDKILRSRDEEDKFDIDNVDNMGYLVDDGKKKEFIGPIIEQLYKKVILLNLALTSSKEERNTFITNKNLYKKELTQSEENEEGDQLGVVFEKSWEDAMKVITNFHDKKVVGHDKDTKKYLSFLTIKRMFLKTGGGNDALNLLKKLLDIVPSRRISAEEALKHPYFKGMDEEK